MRYHLITKTRNLKSTKYSFFPFRVFVLSCFRDRQICMVPVLYPGFFQLNKHLDKRFNSGSLLFDGPQVAVAFKEQ